MRYKKLLLLKHTEIEEMLPQMVEAEEPTMISDTSYTNEIDHKPGGFWERLWKQLTQLFRKESI